MRHQTWLHDESMALRPATFHILLALTNGSLRPADVRHVVANDTHGEIVLNAGNIYGTLRRLEGYGWLHEFRDPPPFDRRQYQITPKGRLRLQRELRRMNTAFYLAGQRLK